MLWVITDTHFDHFNMVKTCGRPENFTAIICDNWRRMVSPQDTIIHLGDCAWGQKAMERLVRLPGHKILVRGNHDTRSIPYYMNIGWDFACDSFTIRMEGVTILFSHAPVWGYRNADINIHGHFHDLHREDFTRLYLPLSLESMGYKPIALDKEFLGVIESWANRHYIPTLKEIWQLRQDARPITERDEYGFGCWNNSKEEYEKKLAEHQLM